jgi:hypothetical protein
MMDNIDTSSGVLHPYYDDDTNMVYVAGKGDGNIRYFEIVKDRPYCYYISVYNSSDAQRGLGTAPKRILNTKECEVMRFYKLHAKTLCEVVSFVIPRKVRCKLQQSGSPRPLNINHNVKPLTSE